MMNIDYVFPHPIGEMSLLEKVDNDKIKETIETFL